MAVIPGSERFCLKIKMMAVIPGSKKILLKDLNCCCYPRW